MLAFISLFPIVGEAEAAAKSDQKELTALSTLSNDELISEGLKCVEANSLDDRAIVMFSIVANRFYENQTDTAIRRAATEALNHLGDLYLTHDIDYRKAYKSLYTARQIAEEDGNNYRLANIYNSLAYLYNYNADNKDDVQQISYNFINKAAEAAVKSGNESMLPTILANIALLTINDDSVDVTSFGEKYEEQYWTVLFESYLYDFLDDIDPDEFVLASSNSAGYSSVMEVPRFSTLDVAAATVKMDVYRGEYCGDITILASCEKMQMNSSKLKL